jgi:hypothetical protein
LACALRAQHPGEWDIGSLRTLLLDHATLAAIEGGTPWPQVAALHAAELGGFAERRRRFLLYR